MNVTFCLILLNGLGFVFAFLFRKKQFSTGIYDAIMCLTAAIMFAIIAFDFLPHVFQEFSVLDTHEHRHEHNHEHHFEWAELNWLKVFLFFGLLFLGYLFQLYFEKIVQQKFKHKFENGMLVFAMFLHSFSESAVLYDAHQHLNKSLLTGIVLHTIPLSFVLAYTILSRTSFKMSVVWYFVFLLAVPLGVLSNQVMAEMPTIFQWISILVSGVVMHVIWHIWESIKEKSVRNYLIFVLGLALGYGVTLFHSA